jgi:hypothetical protein
MSNSVIDRIYDDYCAQFEHPTGTAYNAMRIAQIQQERQQQQNNNAVHYDVRSSSGEVPAFEGAYMPQPARRGGASSSSKEGMAFEELLGLSVACGGAWWGYTSNLAFLPWYGWGIGFMALWMIATLFFYWAAWLTRLIRLVLILAITFYGLREMNEAGILTIANLKAALNLLVELVT